MVWNETFDKQFLGGGDHLKFRDISLFHYALEIGSYTRLISNFCIRGHQASSVSRECNSLSWGQESKPHIGVELTFIKGHLTGSDGRACDS